MAGRGSRARGSRAPRAGLACLAGPAPGHGSRSIPSPEAAWQTLGTLSSALPSPKSKQSILSASSAQLCPGREGPCTKAWNGPPSLGHSPPGCEIRWAETAGGSTGRPLGGGEAGRQLTGCTGACGGCFCSGETESVLTSDPSWVGGESPSPWPLGRSAGGGGGVIPKLWLRERPGQGVCWGSRRWGDPQVSSGREKSVFPVGSREGALGRGRGSGGWCGRG